MVGKSPSHEPEPSTLVHQRTAYELKLGPVGTLFDVPAY
jgi:hypothetical protein